MPIARYHLRCPYGISDPALYSSDGRDNPQALLQGVATAGMTGILRQVGDLAEFAAEIFHELHKDVMSVVARGQGLTVRVQQLESRFPAIEKILFSRSDHVEVYVPKGTDWHPSLEASHNLISLQDIPKFMSDSYEECHGPPPLFMLDKFDSEGAGACLRRYSDPSFFKRNSSCREIQNLEYKKERLTQKTKVKVMHLRDELAGFSSVLDVHAKRLHMVTEHDRNNIPSKCTRLKIRPPNYLNETSEDSYQQIIESHGVCTSCIPIFENQKHVTEIASNIQTAKKDYECLSCRQQMLTGDTNIEEPVVLGETKLVDSDELKFRSPNSGKDVQLEALGQYATKAEQSPDRFSTTELCVLSRMQVVHSANAKEKVDTNTDGYVSADVSSDTETYNYVDALTTYESEHEASDEKNPGIESLTMDLDLIGQQAVLDEVSNNCCSNDTRSEKDEYSSADYSPYLDDVTAKNIYPCRNGGSSNVLEVESTFKPLCTDPGLLFENGLKKVHVDKSYARSENAASEEPEVNTLSHEFGYGLTKICINENGRVSDSTHSQEKYADDVLSPLELKLTGTSAEVLASSTCIPASASSTTERCYVQSSNLCGVASVLMCSSPASDVIQDNEEAPHLPPPPPVEWTTGNNQLGPSLLDMTSGNTQNKSNSLLLVGELPTQAGKCDNLNTSSLVQMQTTNSIISQNCHSVSEEGAGHTGSSKMMVMEEENAHHIPPLHFGIKQQLTPAVKDEKFVPENEKHENKTSSLNTADTMTGLDVSEDSINKELQPLTDTLNAGELPGCESDSPTPASVVTVQHGSPHKSECESIVGPIDMSREVKEVVSNGKLHFHGLRDPLIEAVASHDKSKFRKVSQVIKISDKLVTDQRNALLEEIRNKSFTLRPVSMARPSIKGPPVTNSKLLDILVKASTIRQALAGSDEDDEENWQ